MKNAPAGGPGRGDEASSTKDRLSPTPVDSSRQRFDALAQNLAEVIDSILVAERPRERRIKLIRHHVRHALSLGYDAARRGRS
jgi:hypothetical protein